MTAVRTLLDKSTTPPMKRELLKVRDRLLDVAVQCRKVVGQVGPVPDFVIIGTQKGGTTYLYNQLVRHPQIAPALTKEVHFFDTFYHKGADWYRAYFPQAASGFEKQMITGEASPCYLFHPLTPERMVQLMPDVKLIVLLRNPISRAYSQYHHEVRLGFETLSFEAAIDSEAERLAGERERMLTDESYEGYNYMHYSYLNRGIYVDQLRDWYTEFPSKQLMVIRSEDFYKDTPTTMAEVLNFLEIPQWEPQEGWSPEKQSATPGQASLQYKGSYKAKMDPKMRAKLAEYFQPHNQRLYEFMGRDFEWERS